MENNETGNYIKVNDRMVCYDEYGTGGIPVIFIHGFPFDKSSWKPQLEYLKNSHRVIVYDIRGFGKSEPGQEKFSINLFADDLIKFMEALNIKSAIACGLSMGGYILLNAVHRYPEKFKAIILSDTQCIADTSEVREKRKQSIAQIAAGGLNEFSEGFVKNVFCDATLNSNTENVESIKKIILSTSRKSITQTLIALAERDETCTTLAAISVPTLLICGNSDKISPPAQAEFMHAKIVNSILRIIPNAGHLSNLEQPDLFNKYVLDFISEIA